MREEGIHQISDLRRELEARGVELSSSQTHRLVTQEPERLNMQVLATLCEILRCSPTDLIEIHYAARQSIASSGGDVVSLNEHARPKRAQVLRRDE